MARSSQTSGVREETDRKEGIEGVIDVTIGGPSGAFGGSIGVITGVKGSWVGIYGISEVHYSRSNLQKQCQRRYQLIF